VALPKPLVSYESFTGIASSPDTPGLLALSLEDRNAIDDSAGSLIWLSQDYGITWEPLDVGLDLDPLSRVRVIWVASGPKVVALQEKQNGTVRPLVFRGLSFLERLRGQVGIESNALGFCRTSEEQINSSRAR
jgi:hypothetical protein